jgi:hypothetical protein
MSDIRGLFCKRVQNKHYIRSLMLGPVIEMNEGDANTLEMTGSHVCLHWTQLLIIYQELDDDSYVHVQILL